MTQQLLKSLLYLFFAGNSAEAFVCPKILNESKKQSVFFANRQHQFIKKDLSQYLNFQDLEKEIDRLQGISESNRKQVEEVKVSGSREIYKDSEWRVIKMTSPEAVCEWGKGTKWCTSSRSVSSSGEMLGVETARRYLSYGPMFLFLHNNNGKWEKYAQADSKLQIKDVLDRDIHKPLPSFVNLLRSDQILHELRYSLDGLFKNYLYDISYPEFEQDFLIIMKTINKNQQRVNI